MLFSAPNEISMTSTTALNFNGPLYHRGILNVMNTSNDNRLICNSNPSISQYNPCVTSTSQQVIAATGTYNSEELVLTTESSTNNGLVIGATTCNFTSSSAPTSAQTLLASNDNSNKIPTTAWVQSIIGTAGSVYSVLYTTGQTITTPTNCRAIDLVLCGAGGISGTTSIVLGPPVITYYGGSGSGGNMITANGLPMAAGQSIVLTFDTTSGTGSTTLTFNSVTLAKAYNGNAGSNAINTLDANGASVNSTTGVGDTSFGAFYNTFGSAGSGSTGGGLVAPSMVANGCPKGNAAWSEGLRGMAQRIPSESRGSGYCLITFHIGA